MLEIWQQVEKVNLEELLSKYKNDESIQQKILSRAKSPELIVRLKSSKSITGIHSRIGSAPQSKKNSGNNTEDRKKLLLEIKKAENQIVSENANTESKPQTLSLSTMRLLRKLTRDGNISDQPKHREEVLEKLKMTLTGSHILKDAEISAAPDPYAKYNASVNIVPRPKKSSKRRAVRLNRSYQIQKNSDAELDNNEETFSLTFSNFEDNEDEESSDDISVGVDEINDELQILIDRQSEGTSLNGERVRITSARGRPKPRRRTIADLPELPAHLKLKVQQMRPPIELSLSKLIILTLKLI
ncbi:hypothetical protein HK096_009306 [Nowakowskiella sp. JEL0078]|nr:hypothetical protein HK096_009306 [Nowakowskiella sp. JEL0078]